MAQQVTQRSPHFQPQAPITHVPHDVTLLFIRLLPGPQVARLWRVCKYFTQVVNNENLWARLCRQAFPRRAISSNAPPLLHYQRCFLTEQNWRKGRYVYQRFSTKGTWQPLLSLQENRLICNGPIPSLKICDLKKPTNILTLQAALGTDTMECIEDNELAIVYSSEFYEGGSLHVWDKSNGTLLWNIDCDSGTVVDGTRLIVPQLQTGSIRAWDRKTRQSQPLISDTESRRHILDFDGRFLYTATNSGYVKCWNKDDGTLVRRIGSDVDGRIDLFRIDGETLICLYQNGKIKIEKKEDGSLVHELSDPEGQIQRIFIDNDVIIAECRSNDGKYSINCWSKKEGILHFKTQIKGNVSLYADRIIFVPWRTDIPNVECIGTIEIRDKYTGAILNTCFVNEKDIKIIHVDDHRIFSSSMLNRSTLKIWDIHTGSLLFTIDKVSECKVLKDQMIIAYKDGNVDVCDFSDKPEIPFPHKGQLPAAVKP